MSRRALTRRVLRSDVRLSFRYRSQRMPRHELLAAGRAADHTPYQPTPTERERWEHVLALVAAHIRRRGGPVLRGALGETPDLRHPTSFQADPIPLRKSPHYRVRMTDAAITIVPANEASWEDLQAVFGTRGDPSRCQCQRYKMQPGESWASVGAEELALRLRAQTDCGHPESGTTSGLVAYLDGEPVGWCAVEPRTAYPRLLLKTRVPWEGRAEDKTDDSVWAVTCFVTRAGFRRRGVSRALARAAVDFARDRGARALEGYPMITQPGQEVAWGELHVGSRSIFAAAGFAEVSHPTLRRVVMRIDF